MKSVAELTCVSGQLAANAHVALAGLQVVDGADVVQTSAGNVISRRCIGACHHPGGAQRYGVDLGESEGRFNISREAVADGKRGGGCHVTSPSANSTHPCKGKAKRKLVSLGRVQQFDLRVRATDAMLSKYLHLSRHQNLSVLCAFCSYNFPYVLL